MKTLIALTAMALLVSACSSEPTPAPELSFAPPPTEAPELEYAEYSVAGYSGPRTVYHPIADCAPSRLFVGDRVYVSFGGTSNAIRSYPDVHPRDNILGRVAQGHSMTVIGGPACSLGWLLWYVFTDEGLEGWTAESDGSEFWLIAMDEPPNLPGEIVENPTAYEAYQEASAIMSDPSLSREERTERVRVLQRNYGEETVAWVMRFVPAYDPNTGSIVSFDSYMRSFASEFGDSSVDAPIEQDPVGASLRIFFDPSEETINEMLGLDDWFE